MAKFYTGVGSRQATIEICSFIQHLADQLGEHGWTMRSGGASGADHAFYCGTCMRDDGRGQWWPREIYLPWLGFNSFTRRQMPDAIVGSELSAWRDAHRIAAGVHPAWEKCSTAARTLHTRNVFQVLGRDLASPSKFLICWTPGGEDVGGTRTAIVLARQHGIPVFNLALPEVRQRLTAWVTTP